GLVIDCETQGGAAQLTIRGAAQLRATELAALQDAMWSMAGSTLPETRSPAQVLPLVIAGRAIGSLIVHAPESGADWDSIAELVERAAIALENARLYRSLQMEIEERRGIEAKLHASNRRKDEFLAM